MSKVEALKEQARRHEQNEEWQKACDRYMEAIDRLDEDQPDIGLYNRVGDILIKLGSYDRAVDHFERATDLYLEAELPNNAIAVCKKVIRHLPNRYETYLTMGKIRASQGFLVDARDNFLTYAERMQAAGKVEQALEALVELADLAPDDPDIRMAVAAQLLHHDRAEEALAQLVAGYARLRGKGDEEAAARFGEKVLELDPGADLDALAVEEPETDELLFESTALAGPEADPGAASPDGGTPAETGGSGAGEPDGEAGDFVDIAIPGGDGSPPADPVRAGEPGGSPYDVDVPESGDDLPLISFEEEEGRVPIPKSASPAHGAQPDASDGDSRDGEDFDLAGFEIDTGDVTGEEEEASPDPLPYLSLDDDRDDSDSGRDAEAGRADVVEDGSGADSLDSPAAAPGSGVRVRREWEALRNRCRAEPMDLGLREQLVELAFRVGEQPPLIESYLLLGSGLQSAGDESRARSVYQQVLSLDPGNPEALAALEGRTSTGSPAGEEGPSSGRAKAGQEYVDLGSLIFGDDEPEKTTRFRVAYEEPSGDEEADFARLLTQFKEKVAENFDTADVKAHHDLGMAYKEMGLLDEAVEKFQAALRASPVHLPTYELLGQTFMEQGEHAAAVRVLERALRVSSDVRDEFIGIYYYLGRAHEQLGSADRALEYYDHVFALDINFKDVTERLRGLR